MVSLVAQKEKILLSCYKVLFVLQNHFYPFSHLKLLGLVFLSLSYLLSPEIREQMYLETHFQYEFSFLDCFGKLGLQRKKKLLKFKAESREFSKIWEIYSNSERSEQFLVTECFFNLFLEVSQIYWSNELEQLELKLEKNIGI